MYRHGGQGRKQGPVAVCSLPLVLGQGAPVSKGLTVAASGSPAWLRVWSPTSCRSRSRPGLL